MKEKGLGLFGKLAPFVIPALALELLFWYVWTNPMALPWVILALVIVVVIVYISARSEINRARRVYGDDLTDAQRSATVIKGRRWRVTFRELHRMRHKLRPTEQSIELVMRRYHPMELWYRLEVVRMPAVVWLALVAAGMAFPEWWLRLFWLTYTMVVGGTAVYLAIPWRFTYLLLTAERLMELYMVPVWLSFMPGTGDSDGVERKDIITVGSKKTISLGDRWNVGRVKVDSASQKGDSRFNNMQWVWRYEEVEAILNGVERLNEDAKDYEAINPVRWIWLKLRGWWQRSHSQREDDDVTQEIAVDLSQLPPPPPPASSSDTQEQ